VSIAGPTFLSLSQVIRLHTRALAEHGGQDGVREPGLVDSALASAQNTFWYARGDLFDIAAAYAFHLAESQAFVDGNKRVAAAAALVFLEINGIRLLSATDELEYAMIQIAHRQLDKRGLAVLLHSGYVESCRRSGMPARYQRAGPY
jgi:death-on-curing protein